jgi:hypothetical protein
LLRIELEELQVPAPVSALLALASIGRDGLIPTERTGRIIDYERERYFKTREVPRLAIGLAPDGTAAKPAHLGLGTWRLARRLIVADAAVGQAATLGIRLCERAVRLDPLQAELLHTAARRAADVVLGPAAVDRPLAMPQEWERLRSELLAARPGGGADAITVQQYEVEKRLHKAQLSGAAQYFGAAIPVGPTESPGALRLPLPGEAAMPFDDLVRSRAGDPEIAREILAFVEEWGHVADEHEGTVTVGEFAEHWRVSGREVDRRLELFRGLFPTIADPGLVCPVLWDGAAATQPRGPTASFVRLSSVAVTESEPPDLRSYFLSSLRDLAGERFDAEIEAVREALPAAWLEDQPRPGVSSLYAVVDLALHRWVGAVLAQREPDGGVLLAGLHALGSIWDRDSAARAETWLGSVRRHLSDGRASHHPSLARLPLMSVQRSLRECKDLTPGSRLRNATPLYGGIFFAACSLAFAVRAVPGLDIVEECELALAAMAREIDG